MRRHHAQITDFAEITKILDQATVGRMAGLDADGYPYITPVNFVFHEGRIYFHSALKGEKLDNIVRDPRVGFEVDIPLAYLDIGSTPDARHPCKVHQMFRSVVIRGTARIVPNGPAKTDALNALVAKHEGPDRKPPAVTEASPGYSACHVVEITPERVSGKADLLQNKPEDHRLEVARYLVQRDWPGDVESARALGWDAGPDPDGHS